MTSERCSAKRRFSWSNSSQNLAAKCAVDGEAHAKAKRCLSNIATRRVTPGQAEEHSQSGCERNSRPVRSSKTLLFKRQQLLARLPREKQRSADARSDLAMLVA